jgi:flavin-dependent dehydrogenase
LFSAKGGESIVERANVVVGADGRHSAVARAIEPAVEEETPAYRALYYAYLRDFASPNGPVPDGPEFSLLEDELVAVFPSDAGITCVGVTINRAAFVTFRHDVETGYRERIARHCGLAERFAAATWESWVLGCPPEPSWVRVPAGPGWALVGDAGLHQDPWSGLGIDCACRHASFLADAILDWFAGRVAETDALATFHTRRNEHGLPRYHETQRIAPDLRTMAE